MSFSRWTGFEVTRAVRLSKFVGELSSRASKESELLMCFSVLSVFIAHSPSSAAAEGGDLVRHELCIYRFQ